MSSFFLIITLLFASNFDFMNVHSFNFHQKLTKSLLVINSHRSGQGKTFSTIITPPKVAPPKVDKPNKVSPAEVSPDIIFKQNIDIEKEFNEYTDEETYVVLLYNDPFNKRNYVASCLMEVFSWDEALASSVMLEAHNNGFAVTGEYSKDTAFEYAKKLTDRGLFAEARKIDETGDNASQ